MYSNATIIKVVGQLKDSINYYSTKNSENITISISCGNKKIGRVLNVSLAPIITCANCKECKHLCYDIKACLQYSNVRDARSRNTVLATKYRDIYFSAIDEKLSRRRKNKYFRWHVSGDIIDLDYFCRMVDIARKHSDFVMWTYTKAYFIVNEYCKRFGKDSIPSNLVIMFSEWDGMDLINPYNFPIFSCRLKDGNKNRTAESFEQMFKCPGNCDICKESHRGCIKGEDTYVDEH